MGLTELGVTSSRRYFPCARPRTELVGEKSSFFFFFFFWSKTDRSKLSTETRVPFSGGGKSRARVLIEECIPHSPLVVRAPRQKIGGEMNGENEQGCVLRRRVTSSLTSRWLNAILPPMAQFGSSSRVSLTCLEKEGPFQKPRRWEDGERHPEE